MEEKMRSMIKLIEVDADSFAKKAEMYYQRRPELIKFVEETYKAYKALADRYDRMSGELHKANHTLASAFPDQFQFAMQDDEGDGSPRAFTAMDATKLPKAELPQINVRNKSREAFTAMKRHHKKASSQITKENAQSEIGRIQKGILSLQTEKEFVKSSYESSLAKFWEIESRIIDLQDEVCILQDEHGASSIIEDDEARALMAATAIKSCEESLISLQQQHLKSGEEAAMESERISEVKNRLLFLKGESCSNKTEETFDRELSSKEDERFDLKKVEFDLHSVLTQVKQHIQMNSDTSVVDLAEKIDELVDKVIGLEVTVSSQTAQIQMLRSETCVLQKHLRGLEEDKANSIIDSEGLSAGLSQAESELHRVQDLEKLVHHENGAFQTKFLEACHSLKDISEKLQSPKLEEKGSSSVSSNNENMDKNEEVAEKNETSVNDEIAKKNQAEPISENKQDQQNSNEDLTLLLDNAARAKDAEPDNNTDVSDSPHLLNNGSEGRQKMLIYEYTSILQNYKDTKKKLSEMEKKNQEHHFDMTAQIQELKSINAVKDQEIRALRRKLFSHTSSNVAANSQKEAQTQNIEENGSSIDGFGPKQSSPDAMEEIKLCHSDQHPATSPIEDKFRAELDGLLDENLNFWLRFSTSYHHIQKFEASFKDLQTNLDNLKDSKKPCSDPTSPKHPSKPDTPPLDKKLKELHSELQVWLEQNALLNGELQCRLTSLANIQEEISKAAGDADEDDDSKFTPYQAAKFHGELLNMQQENNKVSMELQTGLDHVKTLQTEVSKALSKVRESFDLSVSNGYTQYQNFRHCSTKSKIPLRIFLFGEKRKKPSIFSCISPALHRHHNQMKLGFLS